VRNLVAVLFHRLGPYHHARLRAASQLIDITAVEVYAMDATYDWDEVKGAKGFRRITLFALESVHVTAREVIRRIHATLDEVKPDAVAIPGWSAREALAALAWCLIHKRPAIIMSDSTVHDEPRTWWKEAVKRRIVGMCAGGLVGGHPHVEYITSLGMPLDHIFTGYDVVDNVHFVGGAEAASRNAGEVRKRLGLPSSYFLVSARFVAKKNLIRLTEAYASYRRQAGDRIWDLVILGDGELRRDLERQRATLGIADSFHLPGFKQYDELPYWYGAASAFVLASTSEQWGLVVNEAMAARLPVLVSDRCGCAADLVEEGINGFTFDPTDVEQLAMLMLRIAGNDCARHAMGDASHAIISRWTPATFAESLNQAVNSAMEIRRPATSLADRALLHVLTAR